MIVHILGKFDAVFTLLIAKISPSLLLILRGYHSCTLPADLSIDVL